jgi:hypothetical protein
MSRLDAIQIDPTKRYIITARGIDKEYAGKLAQSIEDWFASPSRVLMVNVPPNVRAFLSGEVIYLEKAEDNEDIHQPTT